MEGRESNKRICIGMSGNPKSTLRKCPTLPKVSENECGVEAGPNRKSQI